MAEFQIEREESGKGGRYVTRLEGAEAEMTWTAAESLDIIDHTYVPPELRGRSVGEALVARAPLPADEDTPPAEALRPGQRIVLIDDFLGDPAPVLAYLDRAAGLGVRGALLQVLDPDEEAFPYGGAVLFRSASGALRHDTRDAGGLRAAYLARLAERRAALTRAAATAGWHFGTHDTAAPPAQALLWLWSVLEG